MVPGLSRRGVLAFAAVAWTAGSAGCLGGTEAPAEPEYGDWFLGVPNYDGFVDHTDDDPVTVLVGAGEHGVLFEPAAVTVAPGTVVVFEWTGDGGQHNVEHEGGDWENPDGLVDAAGHTYARTFEEPGTHLYKCWPHAGVGMKGAVFVDAHAD